MGFNAEMYGQVSVLYHNAHKRDKHKYMYGATLNPENIKTSERNQQTTNLDVWSHKTRPPQQIQLFLQPETG